MPSQPPDSLIYQITFYKTVIPHSMDGLQGFSKTYNKENFCLEKTLIFSKRIFWENHF
jgi:hypothetical protein